MFTKIQKWLFKKGCTHKWETTDKFEQFNRFGNVTAIIYVQQCQVCGDLKLFRVGVDSK